MPKRTEARMMQAAKALMMPMHDKNAMPMAEANEHAKDEEEREAARALKAKKRNTTPLPAGVRG